MDQALSWWPLTVKAWVQSQATPCVICDGQSFTGTGFSPVYLGLP